MSRDKDIVQRYTDDFRRSGLCLLICAALSVGCSSRTERNAPQTSTARTSPAIDRLFIFVRDWPTYDVELALVREAGQSTVTLFRPGRPGQPRILLDSIGPDPKDPEMVVALLNSFDVWALNAPNAPGAACRTVLGMRSCSITFRDYSLVMRVESGGNVRVQRYTGLEKSRSNRSARALGDFILAWAREAATNER